MANNLNAGSNGWQYNANAQLTSAPASGGLAGASGLTYDACGNLKTCNGNTLTYDAWGRLASITGPNVSLAYTYDGAGRMLTRTSGGVTTYFVYEGDTLLAELDSQGYLVTGYVWGANGLVSQHTANLIILEGSGFEENLNGGEEQSLGLPGFSLWDSLYYLFDGLGNTRGLTDAHGSVVGRSSFSGWGGNLQILGTVTPFARGGQSGGWTENVGSGGSGALVLSGQVAPRVYVPGTGQYGTPSGVGFGGGAHPYANPGADGVNEAPDAGVDSVLATERARWGGVNQLAGQMEGVLEASAGINPACSAAMAFSGYNAAGCRIGWGERLLNGLGAIPGVGALGAGDDVVRAAGSAVKTGNALANNVADGVNVVRGMRPINLLRSRQHPGMLGHAGTQGLDRQIADDLYNNGWTITHGGGRGKQECLKDTNATSTGRRGRPSGTVFPDITAEKDGIKLRIQTVDTNAKGLPTRRESNNLRRIRERGEPGDRLIWFPKDIIWRP